MYKIDKHLPTPERHNLSQTIREMKDGDSLWVKNKFRAIHVLVNRQGKKAVIVPEEKDGVMGCRFWVI